MSFQSIIMFLPFIIGIPAGIYFNKWLFKLFKKNWLAFLVSLLGVFVVAPIFFIIAKMILLGIPTEGLNFGQALGMAFGIVIIIVFLVSLTCLVYVVSSLVTSIVRWRKNKDKN